MTDSYHAHPIHENVLNRQFTATAPNERWASDITYIWTMEEWTYLAIFLDLFNRQVIRWSTGEGIDQLPVSRALDKALHMRRPADGLIHHCESGSQYASLAYRQKLNQKGLTCSMSRKRNFWDNAVVETFFSQYRR